MKRKTISCIALCLSIMCVTAFAQDSKTLLDAYLKNFEKGGFEAKLRIIMDASALNNPDLAPLFMRAVEYAVSVTERGKNESLIRQCSLLATEQCERYQFADARTVVWKLFLMDQDSNVSMKTLKALGVIAKGDALIVKSLNEWLTDRVSTYKANKTLRINVIIRCVMTLGELNNESSFPVVFNVMHAGLSQEIDAICRQVLAQMKGDFKPLLLDLIANGSIREKREALAVALESAFLTDEVKGEIAESAMKKALSVSSLEKLDLKDLREMKARANRALGDRKQASATPLILEHFERSLPEYDRGLTDKGELLEIIRTLGNLGTHEAAQRLTIYLDFLNTFTDQKKVYDERIVLETIESLGRLGDKVAFDVLMNAKFLNYSATIKTNADEAIKSLKW
jgi:hypothetical protein